MRMPPPWPVHRVHIRKHARWHRGIALLTAIACTWTAVWTAVVAGTAAAESAGTRHAQEGRLQGLTSAEIDRIMPYTAAGPVALIEFADSKRDELPAINLLTRIAAPPSQVLSVIRDIKRYPRFMRTLDDVEVVSERQSAVVYDWAWDVAFFRLRGRNSMRVYEPATGHTDRGYRVTVDSQGGDFGSGRMSMRILPFEGQQSLLTISLRLDLRTSNYIARKAAQAGRSVNRSANMALAYTMALSFAKEAQKRSGRTLSPTSSDIGKPDIDEAKLFPLLTRGDLVFLRIKDDRLIQSGALGRIDLPRAAVRKSMLDADGFGSALLPGSSAKVTKRLGETTVFDWSIGIPLIGVSGEMTMHTREPTISVRATAGALAGGQWHFDLKPMHPQITLLNTWAAFDVRKTNMLVRAMADADPYLALGISAASEVMLVRALRTKARKEHPLPAAPASTPSAKRAGREL